MKETDDTEIYGEHELYKANFNIYNYKIHATSHETLPADRYLQYVRQANNIKIKMFHKSKNKKIEEKKMFF